MNSQISLDTASIGQILQSENSVVMEKIGIIFPVTTSFLPTTYFIPREIFKNVMRKTSLRSSPKSKDVHIKHSLCLSDIANQFRNFR